jgi:gliding motility-associated transport system ATP-binding protein
MLTVRNLEKRYGDLHALRDVSFDVNTGDVVGFLGPNGAGKSTTMKIITGYLPPTRGTVRVDGFNVARHRLEVQRRLGYLPESTPLYGDMRVRDYLTYRAKLKGVPRRMLASRVDYVIERTRLRDRTRQIVDTLSKGYKQRVGIADALVGNAKLLILDEPTIGLDPNQIRDVRELIKELGETHTILISTHILVEVEMVCDRVIIVARGKTVADDTLQGLLAGHRAHALSVVVRAEPGQDVAAALGEIPGVEEVTQTREGDVVEARVKHAEGQGPDVAEAVAARVAGSGWALRELSPMTTSLEQIFTRLTQGVGATAPAPSDETQETAA